MLKQRTREVQAKGKRATPGTSTSMVHSHVVLFVLLGLFLEARAFVPQLAQLRTSTNCACRPPPLRVSMQFQSASSATRREQSFKMPKSAPLTSKRQPEGPLEDDPTMPMVEDIIRALDDRKVTNI